MNTDTTDLDNPQLIWYFAYCVQAESANADTM